MIQSESIVKRIIALKLKFNIDDVKLEHVLTDNLGADSLDMLEIRLAIEEAFNISIQDNEISSMRSVDKICELVNRKLAINNRE